MKPVDPRLLRYARAARRHVAVTAVLGIVATALTIAQAFVLAYVVAGVTQGHLQLAAALPHLGLIAALVGARAGVVWGRDRLSHRAATAVVAELRAAAHEAALARGPRFVTAQAAQTTTLLTRGLEDLRPYFVSYLPQLVLAATLTPATVLTIWWLDYPSALIAIFTLPLIPIFMWLVGVVTRDFAAARIAVMNRLGGELLDLLAGLTTLRAFGRQDTPRARVRKLGTQYTQTTMSTLRVAFLSGAVLDFLATLSVALIAVGIGMRMVHGLLPLLPGLTVLLLAPEVYAPLRSVGQQFHASADGVAAAQAACDLIEASPAVPPVPAERRAHPTAADVRTGRLELRGVTVEARGRLAPASLSGWIEPGRITALAGPSGAGKTTTALCLARLLTPADGQLLLHTPTGVIDLADVEAADWHELVTWVAQRPLLTPGTLRQAVAPPGREISDAELQAAAERTGLAEVVANVGGWQAPVGHGGVGLSVGQRQRVALTRALLSDSPLVILDEPSAHLDHVSESYVLACLTELRAAGRTVVVIAHRPRLLRIADAVLTVTYTEVRA